MINGKPEGLNLSDLNKLAKVNPKYAELLGTLSGIDNLVKQFASDTIERLGDPDIYYIKTELLNYCYNMYLYNKERKAIVGYSWLFDDFITKCQTKQIEKDVEEVVQKMLTKFQNKWLKDDGINWL